MPKKINMRKTVKRVIHRIKKILKGFTIVELIIAIAIVAVLASIITVSVAGQVNKAKDSRVKAEISEMVKGVGMYHSDRSTYEGYAIPADFASVCSGSSYTISTNGSSAFVLYAKLCTSDNYWCADSTGALKQIENPPDSSTYACVSGTGAGQGAGEGGCGVYPACSQDYACYDNSVCVQCSGNGLCSSGEEDCRCGDCACGAGDSCLEMIGGSYSCIDSTIVAQFGLLRIAFNNYYYQHQPNTFYGFCFPITLPPATYNYPELNQVASAIRGYGYTFMCAESDEYPEGYACYNHTGSNDYFNTKWYAIACSNSDNSECFCADSTGGITLGSSNDLFTTGLSNCACSY